MMNEKISSQVQDFIVKLHNPFNRMFDIGVVNMGSLSVVVAGRGGNMYVVFALKTTDK